MLGRGMNDSSSRPLIESPNLSTVGEEEPLMANFKKRHLAPELPKVLSRHWRGSSILLKKPSSLDADRPDRTTGGVTIQKQDKTGTVYKNTQVSGATKHNLDGSVLSITV